MVSSELYPFTGKYYFTQGQKLHYLDEGQGDPVVLVHGNPTWSFYYRNLILHLKDQYRCLAPDHIGCGYSDKPNAKSYSYQFKQRVDDFEAWVEHLNLSSKFHLVVHDWGGMIGMAYAVRHPERIHKLVIMNTAAFHIPSTKVLPVELKLARLPVIGDILVRGFNAFSLGLIGRCVVKKKLSKAEKRGYLEPYSSWRKRIAVLRFVQDIPIHPRDPGYNIITETQEKLSVLNRHPTMICWGDKDFVFDHHFLKEWKRLLPEADLHQFPDAGHLVLEDAAEEIHNLVRSFLN
ncbi:MAG TPA: alpha/beta fold hydrolase [Verrucomicrobiales bacterium]|nr:alpha/beta fold hydrolase [Verrucomicrobiales bacterium]